MLAPFEKSATGLHSVCEVNNKSGPWYNYLAGFERSDDFFGRPARQT